MRRSLTCLAAVTTLALAACGNDDGEDVRNSADASGSGSGSGSASGAASGSGSGITVDTGVTTSDPAVQEAVARYTAYVRDQVDQLVADTKVFTDAVRTGDIEAAKAAYAPSRQAWERIEPIAGLVSTIDRSVDARVDDFDSVDDPQWTGWHKLEYLLWETGDISDAGALADRLDADLASLQEAVAGLEIPPAAVLVGAAELIEEVSAGKITGEEDRYSHTDLWDFAANVEGSQQAFELLEPAVEAADAGLAAAIEDRFAEITSQLDAYREGDGYQSFEALTEADATQMKATLADLSERLSQVAGVLGLG